MTTEAVTLSEHARNVEALHSAFKRLHFMKRFRHFVELFNRNRMILAYEKWLKKGCIGIIMVDARYFFPVAIRVFLR
jgi:hypothetical protein